MKTNQFLYERIINLIWVKWVKLPQTLHKKIKKFLMENEWKDFLLRSRKSRKFGDLLMWARKFIQFFLRDGK